MLNDIVKNKSLQLRGVHGVFPANTTDDGEDVIVFSDESRKNERTRFCMLRQQQKKDDNEQPHLSLADYIAPQKTGLKDHIGAFAVAVFGCDKLVEMHEKENDDYSKIMVQALADRLAEAYAEYVVFLQCFVFLSFITHISTLECKTRL